MEDQPNPRDFHAAVFDNKTSQMYVVGGNEKHGKVNYVHRLTWRPDGDFVDPGSLMDDLATLKNFSASKEPFTDFEIVVTNSEQ